jgi:hypothetical protein
MGEAPRSATRGMSSLASQASFTWPATGLPAAPAWKAPEEWVAKWLPQVVSLRI